jgi:hypothetical protein
MTTLEKQASESVVTTDAPAQATQGRRELADWQAQLLALGITIGLLSIFMLVFSLLTGSL